MLPITIESGTRVEWRAPGPQGIQGAPGPQGIQGETGHETPTGGTTGKALVKASDADYDFGWAAPVPAPHAASHAIGGSDPLTPAAIGAVPTSTATTKGDMMVRGSSALERLPVGTIGTNPLLIPDTSASGGLKWGTWAEADVAQASQVGNLLTANVATGTDTLGTTAGFMSQDTTPLSVIESSVEQAARGTRSLKVTTPGSAAYEGVITLKTLPLRRNMPVTFHVRLISATGMSLRVGIFRTGPGYINTFTDVTLTPSTWTTVVFTAVPGAVGATGETFDAMVFVDTGASAQSGSFYCDDIGYWFGAGGTWQPPGVPIPNLGSRANPADPTQVQIWNPGNNTWITV